MSGHGAVSGITGTVLMLEWKSSQSGQFVQDNFKFGEVHNKPRVGTAPTLGHLTEARARASGLKDTDIVFAGELADFVAHLEFEKSGEYFGAGELGVEALDQFVDMDGDVGLDGGEDGVAAGRSKDLSGHRRT